MRHLLKIVLLGVLVAGCGRKEQSPMPALSPHAPQDRPVAANGQAEMQEFLAAITPYVQKARQTYPAARQRYLDGLPKGYTFFAVTKIRDNAGSEEQVFVAVTSIEGDRIRGRLASDIRGVSGYKKGDTHVFREDELIDWLISHPDGTEEGNVVGKFLDEYPRKQEIKK
jgi:hypothetical protein